MKATGIVRKFDKNGRFVVPIELRKKLGLDAQGESLEIFVDEDMIVLKKYEPSCIFCRETKDIIIYNDKKICRSCAEKIKKAAD